MGLFAALEEDEFLATLLLLRDIFDAIAPLNLALQKSHELLCLSDVKTYIDKTRDALKKLAIKGHWFDEGKFKKLKQIATDQTSSLSTFTNLLKNVLFKWDESKEKSQTTLESPLRIENESPKKGFSDSQYEYFIDQLKKNNPKMKMSL